MADAGGPAEDSAFLEKLEAHDIQAERASEQVALWRTAAPAARRKLFADLHGLGHPATAAAAARAPRWWRARAPDSATLFLALFQRCEYALAQELILALREDGHAAAADWLVTSTFVGRRALQGAPAEPATYEDKEVPVGRLYAGQNALHLFIALRKRDTARWEPCAQIAWLLQPGATARRLLRGRARPLLPALCLH